MLGINPETGSTSAANAVVTSLCVLILLIAQQVILKADTDKMRKRISRLEDGLHDEIFRAEDRFAKKTSVNELLQEVVEIKSKIIDLPVATKQINVKKTEK